MATKLQLDSLRYELSALEKLLSHTPEDDMLGRIGLESKKDDLLSLMQQLEAKTINTAQMSLFFSGDPVIGQQGIETDFASKMISKYQELVSKLVAQKRSGEMAARGPITARSDSILHITGVAHGSFGFNFAELTEPNSQISLVDTDLKIATETAAELLNAMATSDTAVDNFVEDLDKRIFISIKELFTTAKSKNATFRIVTSDHDYQFNSDKVSNGMEITGKIEIEEDELIVKCVFLGALIESRNFEIKEIGSGSIISGKINRIMSEQDVIALDRTWTGQECTVQIKRTTVRRINSEKKQHILLSIQPLSPQIMPPIALGSE